MGRGRPTKFKPEYTEQAEKLAMLGATDEQMAEFFHVTFQTFNNWKKDFPDFFESLIEAKDYANNKVKRSLFERATGYNHPEEKVFCTQGEITTHDTVKHYPPETVAAIFWLKNRDPENWRDVKERHDTVKYDESDYNELELARRIAFLLNQGVELARTH